MMTKMTEKAFKHFLHIRIYQPISVIPYYVPHPVDLTVFGV